MPHGTALILRSAGKGSAIHLATPLALERAAVRRDSSRPDFQQGTRPGFGDRKEEKKMGRREHDALCNPDWTNEEAEESTNG